MKSTNLRTPDNFLNLIYCFCSKPASFALFVLVMQNTAALPSVAFPGNESDRISLLAIKSQLVDHPYGVLSSWNNSVHHCNWEGVTCGRKHNRVTILNLNSQGLSGTISPFIANLTFLRTMYLYNNSLHGRIPQNLGDLFRLTKLALANNTLTGEIPDNLSGCINLRTLDLEFNNLEGKLPEGLRALSKLEDFSVNRNNLTGPLFDIIQNLTSLQTISTAFNTFTGTIPDSIGRMQNLTYLALGGNKLHGTLPLPLFNLSSLQVIDVMDNKFHGELPRHMGRLNVRSLTWLNLAINNFSGSILPITNFTNLAFIELVKNSFTGRVPHDFRQFHSLYYLSLSNNYLEGDINFISTLVNCTKLTSLQLLGNNFSGVIPESVANLSTTLRYLAIGDSLVSGIFPAGITNLINLQRVYMGNNKLTTSIPDDLGKLHRLESLDLSFNRLTGNIPDSLGNLSRLYELILNDNKLGESIPRSIGNCPLLYLDLANNELNGTFENKLLSGSASFAVLDLSRNRLEGPLPLEISKQANLEILKLSMNKFSGVLPDGLSECTKLRNIYMDRNSFHGDIPSSYVSLASLQEIDFSQNNLSGPIPAFFSRIPSIYYLNLSHNDFQGRVPTNSVYANASAVFFAGNSGLCGGIPELHLPKCIEKENIERKKKTMPHTLWLMIPVISALVGVLAVATGIYLACIREKKKKIDRSSNSIMGKEFTKVSYDMLRKATGGFSSETLLGSGSFGSVFKGTLDGKTVAVKVLNLQHHGASKSFMAECKALRNIRHRNLVGIITACSSIDFQRNDFRALVYEFMPNGSLDKWLHGVSGNMNLSERLSVAIDVAHSLNYLHNECEIPIVHCDLKPSNILLDHDMVAHVGDFGLAKFLTQPRHLNQSSSTAIRGTIGYAAPEYGLGSEASTAGDIYSFGILLLELMTGKSPTNSMFKDDYNLHMYAKAALPDQVLQIVDPTLEEDNVSEEADNRRATQDALQQRIECIISVVSVGVLCSNHLPQARLKIPDAISRIQAARDNFLNSKQRKRILPARGIL